MPHIHEKIDFVADVFVVHENKVLLRKHDKYNIWLPPGGHIELTEDPNAAAIREVKEEVGLTVQLFNEKPVGMFNDSTELIPPVFLNRHTINNTHEHISFVYFATSNNATIKQGDTEISTEIRWFTQEELHDPAWNVDKKIQYYAETALKKISN